MKYFLHHRVKTHCIKEFKYEELMDCKDLVEEFDAFEPLKGRENITPTASQASSSDETEKGSKKYEFIVKDLL